MSGELHTGKNPAVAMLSDNDLMIFWNDFTPYQVQPMTLRYTSNDSSAIFTGSEEIDVNYRFLMWTRSHPTNAREPIRYVPLVNDTHIAGDIIQPLYEVINPTIQASSNPDILNLSFWTNFEESVTEYDVTKVKRFKQDELSSASNITDDFYRALCVANIKLTKYFVKEGRVSDNSGNMISGTDDGVYELIPVITKPHIVNIYHSDVPILDYGGAGGGGGAFRIHDHRSNFNGGFAFAVFHTGTAVPQLPWENVSSSSSTAQ